jgi:hypothetical protein
VADEPAVLTFDTETHLLSLHFKNATYKFKTLSQLLNWTFIYTKANKYKGRRRLQIYTNDLRLWLNYYLDFYFSLKDDVNKFNAAPALCRIGNKVVGFFISKVKFVQFLDTKYKVGSNTGDAISILSTLEEIKNRYSNSKEDKDRNRYKNWRNGFTSELRKTFKTESLKTFISPNLDLIKKLINETPTGSFIGTDINKEYSNIYSYDINSYYIWLLREAKFPKDLIKTCGEKNFDRFIDRKDIILYCKVTLKGLKAKNSKAYPLYVPRHYEGDNVKIRGSRIISADKVSFWCFYKEEKPLIDLFYDCEEIEIDYKNFYVSLAEKLPEDFRINLDKAYEEKVAAKGTPTYDFHKVKLNRIFGWFLTKRPYKGSKDIGLDKVTIDKEVPYQVGVYLLTKGRSILAQIVADNCSSKGFLSDFIGGHTDSIRTTKPLPEYLCSNSELGKFKLEDIM